MKRRDFLVQSAVLGAGVGAGLTLDVDRLLARPVRRDDFRFDAAQRELAMRALDAARAAGASYADVRINRNRNQGISTREHHRCARHRGRLVGLRGDRAADQRRRRPRRAAGGRAGAGKRAHAAPAAHRFSTQERQRSVSAP